MVKKFLLLAMLVVLTGTISYSQTSREYIRNFIKTHNECKNVAITKTNGDVALYGRNGYAAKNCPSGMVSALGELHDSEKLIDDVQLTENGKWLILYGKNGFRWSNIPFSLENKIREWNRNEEMITSVTFNDYGDWIAISDEHISASADWIQNWLGEGLSDYGQLWAACVTDDAMVAVYERGYKYYGNVPASLKNALQNSDLDVYRIKIAGTAWFFADKYGNFHYNM